MDVGIWMYIKMCMLTPSASQSIDYSLSVLGVKTNIMNEFGELMNYPTVYHLLKTFRMI